ncbi:hypothetical protein PGT21_008963 [Puccinia graminis f. sp. tritici]|uniref:Uncharacterized protein n=1 Tax=Puccinia graminis f. sp. tritici TaxID=56615 RepID=A0A5B0PPL1_PUCGR|nr:hypothetical protein PGT21_008963 [Puccinia graminis f. sp. tritici]
MTRTKIAVSAIVNLTSRHVWLHFAQNLYFLILLAGQAFIPTMLQTSTEGEEIAFKTVDLNELPPDEPPIPRPICSAPPTPSLDAPAENSITQGYSIGLHSATTPPGLFPLNGHSTVSRKRTSFESADTDVEPRTKLDPLESEGKRSIVPVEYQPNWPVEDHESKQGGDTANEIYLRQTGKQPIQSYKNAPTDQDPKVFQLEETERNRVLFNVIDWSFVVHESNMELTKDHQHKVESDGFNPRMLFKVLEKLKSKLKTKKKLKPHQNINAYFWIPREYATEFLEAYRNRRSIIPYPSRFEYRTRMSHVYKTILKLSDEKLQLERYPIFSEGIVTHMSSRLEELLANVPHSALELKRPIQGRIENSGKIL